MRAVQPARVRRVFEETPFFENVRSMFAKLEQRMSAKERAELAVFGDRFVYMPDHRTKPYAGNEDIIDAIQTGILSSKVVRCRYADARGRAREGHLAPLAIALYRHGLYPIAARSRRPRHHGAFGPHLPDKDGPNEILIEFTADKAAYIACRTWHDSQRIEVMPGGAVRVTMRLHALGPVRSGAEMGCCRPLAPSKLVDAIRDEARRTAAR